MIAPSQHHELFHKYLKELILGLQIQENIKQVYQQECRSGAFELCNLASSASRKLNRLIDCLERCQLSVAIRMNSIKIFKKSNSLHKTSYYFNSCFYFVNSYFVKQLQMTTSKLIKSAFHNSSRIQERDRPVKSWKHKTKAPEATVQ